jgi:Ankyrin repeat
VPDAEELRDALLADRVDTVADWFAGGTDVELCLDGRGATPLFYACTPAMVSVLLDHGADPTHVIERGASSSRTGIAAPAGFPAT